MKTRSLAQKFIADGKVRINRDKIGNASTQVSINDVLTLTLPREVMVCRVLAIAERRGPYRDAKLLYEDLTIRPEKDDQAEVTAVANPVSPGRRPTKHERKDLISLKRPED